MLNQSYVMVKVSVVGTSYRHVTNFLETSGDWALLSRPFEQTLY